MPPRFYLPVALQVGETVVLNEPTSHHLHTVLRAKEGSSCSLFNDDGFEYLCLIKSLHRRKTKVVIQKQCVVHTESLLKIHLAQSIANKQRMDYIVQKATELGVASITPIISDKISQKWQADKADKKYQRWHNIMISASEQSGRVQVPTLNSALTFTALIKQPTQAERFILEPTAKMRLSEHNLVKNDILVFIGSESGFNEQELELAQASGVISIKTGPRILRTETVAPAVLAILQHLWGDF